MKDGLEEKIDTAVENAITLVRANSQPDEALKFSQASLNLAHTKAILSGVDKNLKAGAK